MFSSLEVNTVIETPTMDSGIDTIRELSKLEVSPTLHHLTARNIRHLQNILDSKVDVGTQTVETYDYIHNDVGIQTSEVLLNKLEQGIQTIDGSNLNIPSVDLINLSDSPISSISMSTSNLKIDLSSVDTILVGMDPNQIIQMELLNSGVDLSLTEAYIPIPELTVCSDSLIQYLT